MFSCIEVTEVTEILIQEPLLIQNLERFQDSLATPAALWLPLRSQYRTLVIPAYDLFKILLTDWIERSKENATIQHIVDILRDMELKNCSEKLTKDFNPTFKIISKKEAKLNLLTNLNENWWPEKKRLINSFLERRENDDTLLVEKIHHLLTKEKDSTNTSTTNVLSRCLSITGFGGLGKTTLAKWYAHHYASMYSYIIWIDCGEGRLLQSLRRLSESLNKNSTTKHADLKELSSVCFKQLHQEEGNILFIFDNAECYTGANGISDAIPTMYENFHVLITSRTRQWGHASGFGKIDEFQLGLFSKQESIAFLKNNLHRPFIESELVILSEILEHLPLALQISIAILNSEPDMTIGWFITSVQKSPVILQDCITLDDYEQTIFNTMQISIEKIRQNEYTGELAFHILLALCHLQPDNTDIRLFAEIEHVSNNEIELATKLLEKYSLVTFKPAPLLEAQEMGNEQPKSPDKLKQFLGKIVNKSVKRKVLSWKDNFAKQSLEKDADDNRSTNSTSSSTSKMGQLYSKAKSTSKSLFIDLAEYLEDDDEDDGSEISPHYSEEGDDSSDDDEESPGKVSEQFGISIHRLLQKVLRLMQKDHEETVLRKILNMKSKSLLHYKLVPYMTARNFPNLIDDCKIAREEIMQSFKFYSISNIDEGIAFLQIGIDHYKKPSTPGDAKSNSKMFNRFQTFFVTPSTSTADESQSTRSYYLSLHNYGLLCFATKRYVDAITIFEEIREAIISKKVKFKIRKSYFNDDGFIPFRYIARKNNYNYILSAKSCSHLIAVLKKEMEKLKPHHGS